MFNFQVNDMTCSHCVATVEKAVRSVDSSASIKVDLANLAVAIESAKPASGRRVTPPNFAVTSLGKYSLRKRK